MEMENSRRPPFDRPRDLSIKKPRLAEEQTLASRQFQRSATQFRREEGALQQYMQHQELINQYKTALAELTFNSKPIITNLTIIAGENLQAAKAIAATICSNILEVPIEQKLPSLYLLDSIVKNIGRDYIKYFAARLPEVFCKVYRQANPSMHTSMQHLFKTWRVVFPPQMLQIIEKELGFQAVANGSSSGSATSKAESQSQRQQHSIHVNPKYLEARQRLQQPNRPQVTNIGGADVGSPERTASTATGRPWANPSVKMPTVRPQREALREAGHQKQGGGNYDIAASALARSSRTLVGKPTERLIGQDKRWPGASREVEESRMEYEKYGPSNYTGPRSAGVNVPSTQSPPRKRSNAEMSRSWKNSEEEEYLWDDLGNGITGPSDGLEKLEFGDCKAEVRSSFERETSADTLSSELKEQVADGHSRSSLWKMHEPYEVESSRPSLNQAGTHSVTGLSSEAVSSSGFQTAVSGTMGSMVQRQPSPGQSAMNRRSPSPSLSKRDPRQRFAGRGQTKSHSLGPSDPRTASLSGQVSVGLHDKSSQSAMPSKNQNLQSGLAGDSNVSSLLAAVVKSGFLSDSSVADHPSVGAPASASITKSPQNKAGKPPLPSGSSSSPSPVIDPSAQNSDMANANSNPLSSLFSSLLAKGLISKSEPTPSTSLQSVEEVKEESPVLASKPPVEVEPALKTSIASKEPTIDKLSSSELTGNKPDTSVQNMKDETETQNLIGYEFKPPVIRALHPEVIDRVTEEVPHKCNACGLRYKLKGQLDRHTEWHTFRNSIPSSLIRPSRRWYSSSTDWAAGKAGFPCGYKSTSLSQESGVMSEKNEQVIPADENQYVCLLCGELFEDFYTEERDEWMFKGAVYMSIPSKDNQTGPSDESGLQKLIVHAKCSSDDAVKCLGLGQWHSSGKS